MKKWIVKWTDDEESGWITSEFNSEKEANDYIFQRQRAQRYNPDGFECSDPEMIVSEKTEKTTDGKQIRMDNRKKLANIIAEAWKSFEEASQDEAIGGGVNGNESIFDEDELLSEDVFDSMMASMNTPQSSRAGASSQVDFSQDDGEDEEPSDSWDTLEFVELSPEQQAKMNLIYPAFEPVSDRYQYQVEVVSMDGDDSLDQTLKLKSNKLLSLEQLFEKLWPSSARKWNLDVDRQTAMKKFETKMKELTDEAERAKSDQNQEAFAETMQKIKQAMRFPRIKSIKFGDMTSPVVEIASSPAEFDELTNKGLPAAKFTTKDSDDPQYQLLKKLLPSGCPPPGYVESTELEFNKAAEDELRFLMYVGGDKPDDEILTEGILGNLAQKMKNGGSATKSGIGGALSKIGDAISNAVCKPFANKAVADFVKLAKNVGDKEAEIKVFVQIDPPSGAGPQVKKICGKFPVVEMNIVDKTALKLKASVLALNYGPSGKAPISIEELLNGLEILEPPIKKMTHALAGVAVYTNEKSLIYEPPKKESLKEEESSGGGESKNPENVTKVKGIDGESIKLQDNKYIDCKMSGSEIVFRFTPTIEVIQATKRRRDFLV